MARRYDSPRTRPARRALPDRATTDASCSARRASASTGAQADGPSSRSATRRCSSSSTRPSCSTTASPPRQAGFSGIMAADHLQPWVPAAGPGGVRVGVHGRRRRAHQGRCRTRRHVPDVPHPSRGDCPGRGDAGGDVSGPFLAGPRIGRGAQRARRGPVLAGGAGAHQPDVRGDRDLQPPVHRQGRQARRALLQDGDGAPVDAARDAAGRSMSRRPDRSRPSAPGRPRDGHNHRRRARGKARHDSSEVRARAGAKPDWIPTTSSSSSSSTCRGRRPTKRRSPTR